MKHFCLVLNSAFRAKNIISDNYRNLGVIFHVENLVHNSLLFHGKNFF